MYNIVLMEEGYKDFYTKSKTVRPVMFVPVGGKTIESDGSRLTVDLFNVTHKDNGDGTFSTADLVDCTHRASYGTIQLKREGTQFESYFDTFNIQFFPEANKDHSLEIFIKAAVTLAGMEISHSADGSFTFVNPISKILGNSNTASVIPDADGVAYQGRLAFIVKRQTISHRAAHSIKFRIEAKTEMQDEFKIYSIEINSAGLLFEGEVDDA